MSKSPRFPLALTVLTGLCIVFWPCLHFKNLILKTSLPVETLFSFPPSAIDPKGGFWFVGQPMGPKKTLLFVDCHVEGNLSQSLVAAIPAQQKVIPLSQQGYLTNQ